MKLLLPAGKIVNLAGLRQPRFRLRKQGLFYLAALFPLRLCLCVFASLRESVFSLGPSFTPASLKTPRRQEKQESRSLLRFASSLCVFASLRESVFSLGPSFTPASLKTPRRQEKQESRSLLRFASSLCVFASLRESVFSLGPSFTPASLKSLRR